MSSGGARVGLVGDVETEGYNSGDSEALDGMRTRDWTINAGLTAGVPLGPFPLLL